MTSPSLDQLRDIHLPPSPGLWPPAPGWWLVALALGLGAVLWVARRRVRQRPLRAALRELDALARTHAHHDNKVLLARGISRLLRRYALWRFPQAGAAGLTDADWLRFLDQHGGAGRFTQGPGAQLASLPYRPAGAADRGREADAAALLALARHWLRTNAP